MQPRPAMPPQLGQPRDPAGRPPEPVGTGIIRGRVVTSDSGNPVRRANVTLDPGAAAPTASARRHPGRHHRVGDDDDDA